MIVRKSWCKRLYFSFSILKLIVVILIHRHLYDITISLHSSVIREIAFSLMKGTPL